MKKRAITNPGYEAFAENLPETMGIHRLEMVHALTVHTLRHYKPSSPEKTVRPTSEQAISYTNNSDLIQHPASMSPETQAQIIELSQQRDVHNQADIRLAVDLAYETPIAVPNFANENPIYDQKAA